MTQEKELLLKDLCARLPYGVKFKVTETYTKTLYSIGIENGRLIPINLFYKKPEFYLINEFGRLKYKPYLRLMSSMTEDEAREITKISGILTGSENILSISVKEEFIDIKIDDGVCSTETRTLWFTEMPTSITQLDYLNAHHFDYRGLIPMGLALEAPKGMYN